MPGAWKPRFTAAEMVFSLKCFAASMLAMYVASRAGLPRPFWALVTAYVVASPLAGAVRSKALYRFLGTLFGSVATLLLVPALAGAPELLTLALALWVAACLFFALLDRTPRSYVLMLAGYSAALIGFPAVDTPQAVFETASARVEEIGIGILCATLVHSLVWPGSMSTTLLALIDKTLDDARAWTRDIVSTPALRGSAQDAARRAADRRRLAGDITQLRILSTHLPFDTSNLITVSLETSSRGMLDLAEGGIDMALQLGPVVQDSCVVERLVEIDMVVCAAPSYWRRRGVPQRPEELGAHDALTLMRPGARPVWSFQDKSRRVDVAVNSRMDASEAAPLVMVAVRGFGAIYVPRLTVQPHLDRGELVAALQTYSRQDVWLTAAYRQRRNMAAVRALLEFLRAAAQQQRARRKEAMA